MVEYIPSSRTGYVHQPQRVNSLDMNAARPAPSRRQSGEDMIIPSVERDSVLSPNRRAFPESTYNDGGRFHEPSNHDMLNRMHYREPVGNDSYPYATAPRGYVTQKPEYYRTPEMYAHSGYPAPRDPVSRAYVGEDLRYARDGGLQYVPRGLH
jgi:hypothetical protein